MLLDFPSITKHHPVICNECFRNNRKHVPRNPPDSTTPPLFSKIGCDFTFYSNLSLRGHNSAFTCVDHTSRYPFAFPTCAKRPPIATIQFFVGCLRNMGFKPVVFKMDEGGELCKSTEFCQALINMNLIIQSTGGDNKTSNGRVEVFHRTLHQMNRSTLATMESFLPDPLPKGITLQSFWDLSLGYVVQLKRILYHSSLDDSPYFTVFKRRPSYRDYHLFGSPCEIVKDKCNKLITTSRSGFFVGKGNNTGAFLFWCPSNPYKVLRAHHVWINDASCGKILQGMYTQDKKTDPRSSIVTSSSVPTPFDPDDVVTYELTIPHGNTPLGMRILDDPDWNIPKLENCLPATSAYKQLAPVHRRNMHIVSIDGVEPITADYAISLLAGSRRLRSETHRTVTLQMSKRKSRCRSAYEQHRASFDTLRPIIASHQAVLTAPPPSVSLIHQAYSGRFKKNYIAATFKQFEDNASLFVYGKPILRSTLPADAILLPSIMAPSFKRSHDLPNLYKFKVRHTLHGGKWSTVYTIKNLILQLVPMTLSRQD